MLKLWYMWAHSGIPKYETYVAYFINRLVVLLELLEIALKHLERNWPGMEAFQRSTLMPWSVALCHGQRSQPCGHVTATAARKPGVNVLPEILQNPSLPLPLST